MSLVNVPIKSDSNIMNHRKGVSSSSVPSSPVVILVEEPPPPMMTEEEHVPPSPSLLEQLAAAVDDDDEVDRTEILTEGVRYDGSLDGKVPTTTTTPGNTAVGVALEIDSEMRGLMEDLGLDEEDLERGTQVVAETTDNNNNNDDNTLSHEWCCGCDTLGHCTVILPRLYRNTGLGIVGPHWWGVCCTLLLLLSASQYYVRKAYEVGAVSFGVSLAFAVFCPVALFFVACADPGYIHADGSRQDCRKYVTLPTHDDDDDESAASRSDIRFCGFCNVYQPSDARHCQDCGLCVVGYDHHCPWMGTCIGKHNMRAFVVFNISWLLWLLYAVGWVTLGSALRDQLPHHHH